MGFYPDINLPARWLGRRERRFCTQQIPSIPLSSLLPSCVSLNTLSHVSQLEMASYGYCYCDLTQTCNCFSLSKNVNGHFYCCDKSTPGTPCTKTCLETSLPCPPLSLPFLSPLPNTCFAASNLQLPVVGSVCVAFLLERGK